MIGTDKGPDAFRTISEVADDLDVPQHVLRFWETRFTPIRPLKRGGGRRYYRPDDVELLKGIRHLLYGQGYTIKGVQRILKQDGLRFVQAVGRGEQNVAPGQGREPDDGEDDGSADVAGSRLEHEPTAVTRLSAPEAERGHEPRHPAILSPDARAKLRAALDELRECQRIFGTLKGE